MEDLERREEDIAELKTANLPDAGVETTESQDSDKTEEADNEEASVDKTLKEEVKDAPSEEKNVTVKDAPEKVVEEKEAVEKEKTDEKKEDNEENENKEDEDEDEEAEEDVIVLEDIEDDGEDPSEVEVEKYNQPGENFVLHDLSEMKIHRKVVIHPLKMSELSHPVLLEAIGKSSEFRTCFVQNVTDGRATWSGYTEINFRSAFIAADSIQSLKTIREDITVRCLEAGETAKNIIQSLGGGESVDATKKLLNSILLVKAITEEITIDSLRETFSTASDIVIPQNQRAGKRMAYVIYDSEAVLEEAHKQYLEKLPEVDGKTLRVLKYQPTSEMPSGLLKMKRRYRVLLQMDKLKKAIKDKKANHTKNVKNMISSTIQHCKTMIEKDDSIRKELGLSVYNLAELRRYKRIREAVKEDTIWLPGKKMHGPERRGFLDEDDDEDRQRRLV